MRVTLAPRRVVGALLLALGAAGTGPGAANAQSLPSQDAPAAAAEPSLRLIQSEAQRPGPGERIVSAAEWRRATRGRTLSWREFGAFSGREYYNPNGDTVVFIDTRGRCYTGRWGPDPSGAPGMLCFEYRGPDYEGRHCDLHLARGDQLLARRRSGRDTVVIEMTDEVLSCDAPSS